MGIESILGAVAAPVVGSVVGGLFGSKGSSQSGTQTQTTQQELDPRIQSMLFGDGTDANKGLLAQYQGYLNQPQNAGTAAFGNAAASFLGGQGGGILNQLQNGSNSLLGSSIAAPQSNAASAGDPRTYNIKNAQASTVAAPSQNSIDLSSAYDKTINGNAGANPYLTGALQSAVDQTNTSYQRNQDNLTNTLQRSILPGIRSISVLAGQYGGTRQGIAEGNALSDYTNQLTSSNLALGQANSANTTGAQAQAFNQGQDRSLAALQGLSGQQYGVAGQNSSQAQATNLTNANAQNAASAQSANAYNSMNQYNAGLQQQTGLANQSAQLQTNGLNSTNQQAGLAGLSGLLSSVYGYGQNQDNYGINRATQVNGLLAPYLSANSSQTSTSPTYTNTGANILGGATAGLGLYNGIKNAFSSGNTAASTGGGYVPPWGLGGY